MENGAVGRQHERGGLQVPVSLPSPRITPDRAGYRFRIEPIGDREFELELAGHSSGLVPTVGREGYGLYTESCELHLVILEVSQLLTAMASKMPAVEEQDRGAALQSRGQPKRSAVQRVDFEVGKSVPNLTGVH